MSQFESCLLCETPVKAFAAQRGLEGSDEIHLCPVCRKEAGRTVDRLRGAARNAARHFEHLSFDTDVPMEAYPLEAKPDRKWRLVIHRVYESRGELWNHFVVLSNEGEVRSVFSRIRSYYRGLADKLLTEEEEPNGAVLGEVDWLKEPWRARGVSSSLVARYLEAAVSEIER